MKMYNEIEIENILEENRKLIAENTKLKNKLADLGYYLYDENKKLSSDEAIDVIKSYFRGRTDVYANRYIKKDGKKAYSFSCENEFAKGICKKSMQGGKACKSCIYRKYKPLTNAIIKDHCIHLNKKKGIGIYPLLTDNTCYFLAIDFDHDNWFEELLCVYRIAKKFNIDALMERSQSGMGGHLWIFFESPIKALKARKLGDVLISEAMKRNKNITFNSLDRFFPNQDFIPEKGLGNLIALPLHCESYKKGNACFINEYEQKIKNPVLYLSTIKKMKEEDVDNLISVNKDIDYFLDDTNQLKLLLDGSEKLVTELYISENTMLCIEKKNLNAYSLNCIRRLASLKNPDYAKMQRLHKAIYLKSTPRYLEKYEEDATYIKIPRGLKDKLEQLFMNAKILYNDERCTGKEIEVTFKGELYEDQKAPVNEMMKHDIGILEAKPGYGKTVIALNMIAKIKVSTLIIVPSKDLMNQWLERINDFLDVPQSRLKRDAYVGVFYGGKKKLKYNLDVAIVNSLARAENLLELINGYGLVIIDECHHVASNTFIEVMQNIRAKRIYSFSATPKREDKLDEILFMYCGQIKYILSKSEMKQRQNFIKQLIPRYTTTRLLEDSYDFVAVVSELYKDYKRNDMITMGIIHEFKEDSRMMILSDRVEHLNIFYEKLRDLTPNIYVINSRLSQKERKEISEKLKKIQETNYIILATGKLLGEGFDLPSLNTMFFTIPISADTRITQYVGRLHRDFPGKNLVKVFDYVDINIRMFDNMFRKRLKQYSHEGYQILDNNKPIGAEKALFNKDDFEDVLLNDIFNAKNEIIVINKIVILKKIKKYFSNFQSKIQSGIKGYIFTNEKQKNFSEVKPYLDGVGLKIRNSNDDKHAIVIDKSIVWYCDFDFFGYQYKEMNSIRIVDAKLANEIIENILASNEEK